MFLAGRVKIITGDITKQAVDAIVNAANRTLLGGGGVDGAIHQAGGPTILKECKRIRRSLYPDGLPTGEAVITTGGLLPARHVIHTVGPVYGHEAGREAQLLANCYQSSLAMAVAHGLDTIAFPAISTGVFGYPPDEAALVSSKAVAQFLAADDSIREVRFVFFSEAGAKIFLEKQKFER